MSYELGVVEIRINHVSTRGNIPILTKYLLKSFPSPLVEECALLDRHLSAWLAGYGL